MIATSPLMRRLSVGAVVPILTVFALGCGSSSKSSTDPNPSTADSTTVAAKASASTSTGLTGTWSGHYTGASSGTFNLTWTQSGSNLTGTIKISDFGDAPIPINGTLQGDTISFGTVGSTAVTYTGSVSGSSMSGDWKVQSGGQSGGGGSWNATKS
jgi:hypothetical protein